MLEALFVAVLSKFGYSIPLFLLASILLLSYFAYRYRVHGGHFNLTDIADGFVVESAIGRFTFNKEQEKIFFDYKSGRKDERKFSEIKAISYRKDLKYAQLEEFFFDDFSLYFNTKIEYIDAYRVYALEAYMVSGEHLPIFVCAQYKVRDVLDVSNRLDLDLLSMLRLYTEVEHVARQAYLKLNERMAGLPFDIDDHTYMTYAYDT